MPRLTIDGVEVQVEEGATVLQAARIASIKIPTLCNLPGRSPRSSCLVCVVRIDGEARMRPSCAARAEEGMVVESGTAEVLAQRRTAVELLLSDHLGDCVAPCQVSCPAHLDIPRFAREVAAGRLRSAAETTKDALVLPATLARLCPAMCERGCRRASADGAVSIRSLHGYVADWDLCGEAPYTPLCAESTSKSVAVVGSGAAALAAAFELRRLGHAAVVYDPAQVPGGELRAQLDDQGVLDAEIATLARMGVEFRLGSDSVTGAHDAAVGPGTGFVLPQAGGAAGAAVRSVAAGRRVAHRVHAYLGGADTTQDEAFSVHAGRLDDGGTVAAMAMGAPYAREEDFDGSGAARQAARCLHCDCRKADTCRLRAYAQQLGANPKRFAGERKSIGYDLSHPAIIFEPNKCIACGICVRIAAEAGEELGLSFSGRGFEVHTAVPFGGTLESGLRKAALACAEACPTGALSPREDPDVP